MLVKRTFFSPHSSVLQNLDLFFSFLLNPNHTSFAKKEKNKNNKNHIPFFPFSIFLSEKGKWSLTTIAVVY